MNLRKAEIRNRLNYDQSFRVFLNTFIVLQNHDEENAKMTRSNYKYSFLNIHIINIDFLYMFNYNVMALVK